MVKIEHLFSGYQKKEIIKDINLICKDKSITTIVGPNGCGKSTLLKSIAGLADVFRGEIYLNDRNKNEMSDKEIAREIAYLFQQHDTPIITVERLVLHGRFPYLSYPRHYRKEDMILCDKIMRKTGVYDFRYKKMTELSGGQIQKVYLAMVLARETDILLFDEPTTYLDIKYQLEFLEIMQDLKKEGKTIVSVMHDINHAMKVSDQIILMDSGRIIKAGTPEEIYHSGKLNTLFNIELNKVKDSNGMTHYLIL